MFLAKSFSQFSRVRFNAVAPGLLKTSASAGIPGYVDSYLYAEQATLRKQAVQTEEVANVAAFLLSPRSSGINAQSIVVDAGMSINYFDRDLVRRAMRPSELPLPGSSDEPGPARQCAAGTVEARSVVFGHQAALPIDGQHQRVDARADAQQGDVVAGLRWPCSMPRAIVSGRATEPVLPSVSNVAKSIAGSRPSDSSISLRCAAPTWWQNVLSISARDQPASLEKGGKRGDAGGDAFVHQPLANRSASAGACRRRPLRRGRCGKDRGRRCGPGPWRPAGGCRCGSARDRSSSTAALAEPIVSEAMASLTCRASATCRR